MRAIHTIRMLAGAVLIALSPFSASPAAGGGEDVSSVKTRERTRKLSAELDDRTS